MAGRGRGRGASKCQPLSEISENLPDAAASAPETPTAPILINDAAPPAIGRGRGRGRGIPQVEVNELPSSAVESENQPRQSEPAPPSTSTRAQFADADEKIYYTIPEYSPFDPKPVLPMGSGGGYVYQSIQKCTHVQYYKIKVARDSKLGSILEGLNRNEVAGAAGLALDLALPAAVNDFEVAGSFPICVQEDRVDFIRDVIICCVNRIQDFVIRPAHNFHFVAFTTKLNAWYNANAQKYPAPEIKNLVRGGHYVAFSSKTKTWCRVAAVNWKENGEVMLEMFDFGGLLHTFIHEMRYIRRIFCDFPIQAVHAKLEMAAGSPVEFTHIYEGKFKVEVEGKQFPVMTINHEVDPASGKRTLGIILLQNVGGVLRPYTFGGAFSYGYQFSSPTKKENEQQD